MVRVICSTGVLDGLGDCVIPVIFTLPFLALKTALPEERIYAAGVFPVQHYDTTQEFAAKALADMTKVQMPEQTIASFRTRLDSKGGSMVAVWAEDELTMELFEVQRDFGPEAARQVAYEGSQTPKLWRRNETRFGHS